MEQQAIRWATRFGEGVVNVYEYYPNDTLKILKFEKMTEKWLDFIKDVIKYLGEDLERIYNYEDVFHCEPIEKVANDFIKRNNIPTGEFDNLSKCKYNTPDYWEIGEVFERLIEDIYDEKNVFKGIKEVFSSWLAEKILNFNSDLYYQSRQYLAKCYKAGKIIIS